MTKCLPVVSKILKKTTADRPWWNKRHLVEDCLTTVIPNKRGTTKILCNLSYTTIMVILMKKARKKWWWTISKTLLMKFLRIWKMISSMPTTRIWWITIFTWCRIENTKTIERSQICKVMREIMAIMMMTMMINRIWWTRKTTWTTAQMMITITTGRLKNINRVPTLKPKQRQIKSLIKITKFKMNASTKMNWSDTTPRMLQMPCSHEKRERYQAQF